MKLIVHLRNRKRVKMEANFWVQANVIDPISPCRIKNEYAMSNSKTHRKNINFQVVRELRMHTTYKPHLNGRRR